MHLYLARDASNKVFKYRGVVDGDPHSYGRMMRRNGLVAFMTEEFLGTEVNKVPENATVLGEGETIKVRSIGTATFTPAKRPLWRRLLGG